MTTKWEQAMERMLKVVVFTVLVALGAAGCSRTDEEHAGPARVVSVPIDSAWARNSVNGTIFRRDPLASDGQYQYVAYYDSVGCVVIGKRELGSQHWQLEHTGIEGGASDAHNSISIAVDGNGLLHVAFGCHCTPLHYYVGNAPGGIKLVPGALIGRDEEEVTYPEFYRMDNGDLLFTYRAGASMGTRMVLNRYDCALKRWQRVQDAVVGSHEPPDPYWQMCVDGQNELHLTWVWRGVGNVESNHDICYAWSSDGGVSWKRTDGTPYTLPIDYTSGERIAAIGPHATLINQGTMAMGAKGEVYLATYFRGEDDTVPQYYVFCKQDGAWSRQRISQRTENFTLDGGGGTRGIPISRPLIAARHGECYVFCREVADSGRVGMYCGRYKEGSWTKRLLAQASVLYWEPSFDSYLWRTEGLLHLYLQRMMQDEGSTGENMVDMSAQPNYVLEVRLGDVRD